jgi:mannonate dehydratase
MRPGLGQFNTPTAEFLRYAAQYGATDVLLNRARIPALNGVWELHDLVELRNRVQRFGVRLAALENLPIGFYDDVMMGGPRRDQQIENMMTTVRNVARAGIPILGYGWNPTQVWRGDNAVVRCGAEVTAFDYETAKNSPNTHHREYSEGEMWANLEYWIRAITPVAEEEGIRLGIHPTDPPVSPLGGVAMPLRSFAAYRRLIEIVDSPSNAIEFCQGTFSEMQGEDIYEMIRYFGERKKILYVHFRNVSGQAPKFHEEFINSGYVDMYRAMTVYRDVGFDGFFIDDHVPHTHGDTTWGHRGRAFAMGYIQALIEAVQKQADSLH